MLHLCIQNMLFLKNLSNVFLILDVRGFLDDIYNQCHILYFRNEQNGHLQPNLPLESMVLRIIDKHNLHFLTLSGGLQFQ